MDQRLKRPCNRRWKTLMGLSLSLILTPAMASTMETPFDQARAVVQEMMGDAITADAAAVSAEEKGRAQERIGFAIVNLALIDAGEPKEMIVADNSKIFVSHAGKVQEMLGEAIMEAAWARTYPERARAQEMLGILIVNSTLIERGVTPIGMGGEDGTVVSGP